jgi:hypothetical protein
MPHAAFGSVALALLESDFTVWVWGILIAFWIISSAVTAIRRMVKRAGADVGQVAQQAEATPEGQRLTHTVQSIGAQAQATAVAAELEMQVKAAATAAARTAPPMGHAPALVAAALVRQPLLSELADTLGQLADQGGAQAPAPMTTVPQLVASGASPSRLAQFAGPSGLAAAIVAAAVIGPCAALRSEPIEPGGW